MDSHWRAMNSSHPSRPISSGSWSYTVSPCSPTGAMEAPPSLVARSSLTYGCRALRIARFKTLRAPAVGRGRQRRDMVAAARRVVPRQARELVEQPPRRKHLEQGLDLARADQARGDHQVESLGGQRDEGQAVRD